MRLRIVGVVMTILSCGLALYSFPFASLVALGAFLLGIAGIVIGVSLVRQRPTHGASATRDDFRKLDSRSR
jgi:hypothetical protein